MKILDEIIEECIEANALFTTYDIIPEAHTRGCTLSIESISEYVKNYRYPIFYTRTIRDLGCEIMVPIYHPADLDASTYDASDILPKSSNAEISSNHQIPINVSTLMTQSAERMMQEKSSLKMMSTENHLHALNDMVIELGENIFTRKQVKDCLNITDYRAIKYLHELEEQGHIEKVSGHNGSLMLYVLTDPPDLQQKKITQRTHLFDNRGRYHVRVSDVQKAGFEIGEKVNIMLDKQDNTLVITNKRQSKRLSQIGGVKVDMYQNISIAKSPFRKLNKTEIPKDLVVTSSKREIKIIPCY